MKIATSSTLEGITKLVNEYYYSTTCRIEDGKVYNSKGEIKSVEVVQVRGKFIFKHTGK